MSENIDINIAVIKEEVSINAANNLIQVNINSAPISIINPQNYDLSQFTNTSPNPFVQQSALGNYVPTSRTLTINGLAQDLSTDRSWTISTGLTIGTTPIASGTIGRVLFEGTGNVLQQSANLFWDNTNNRLGVGITPSATLDTITSSDRYAARIGENTANADGSWTGIKFHLSTNTSNLDTQDGTANIRAYRFGAGNQLRILAGTTTIATFGGASSALLVGTTTDAGFRLDVNGTARVSGSVSVIGGSGTNLTVTATAGAGSVIVTKDNNFVSLAADGTSGYINYGVSTSGTRVLRFIGNGSEVARFFTTGNLGINTTTDAGFKLDVNGTARVSDLTIIGSGNTGVTSSFTVQNSIGTQIFKISNENTGLILFLSGTTLQPLTSAGNLKFSGSNNRFYDFGVSENAANSTGDQPFFRITKGFNPTSGTGTYSSLLLTPTINQTGGANGITRGLFVNPTLTAAADFRAIETTAGNVLFGSNFFWDNTNERLGIGTGTPTEKVHVFGGAAAIRIHSTTNESSLKYNNSTTTATIKLSNNDLKIELGSSERARIFSNGNVLIQNGGTFTDAGFKLDVNGTARVSSDLIVSTGLAVGASTVYSNSININNSGAFRIGNAEYLSKITNDLSIFQGRLRVNQSGNILINTTTDAGFRLDVNGTARVAGGLNIGTQTPTAFVHIAAQNALQTDFAFRIRNSANTFDILRVTNDGTTCIGIGAGASNAASNNILFGGNAGRDTTTGGNNIFIGFQAGRFNTTGTLNVFNGAEAGLNNTTSASNSFFGASSGRNNTLGNENTAVGFTAGRENTTGSQNAFFGLAAGRFIADGTTPNTITSNSVFLGASTKALADNQTNQIVIGHNAIGAGNNTVTLGNTSIVKTILRGTINAAGLPTSPVGLSTGDVWNNLGILTIVL
jgi:hypothetical protein